LIEFIVSDTGTGIPEENLETIFDPFIQAANTTTSKYGGTGLGLGIVKKLVELMGGKVSVRSKLNEGSTFSFVLPLKITTAIEVSKESKILLRTQELGKIGRLKILLAEDNLLNQYLIESIMREYAFEVDTAENGRLAVELLENNSYDIILMDLMMPEMDGYEATKHIRTKMKLPKSRIPIIALTADVNKQVVLKSTKAGMNDYISKPFNEIELLNKISTLVKKSKYQKNGD
jgi:CheY-like chemotaxis protein